MSHSFDFKGRRKWKCSGGRGCLPHTQSLHAHARSQPFAAAPVANSRDCCFVFFFFCHKQDLVSFSHKISSEWRRQGQRVPTLFLKEAQTIFGLCISSATRNYSFAFFFLILQCSNSLQQQLCLKASSPMRSRRLINGKRWPEM